MPVLQSKHGKNGGYAYFSVEGLCSTKAERVAAVVARGEGRSYLDEQVVEIPQSYFTNSNKEALVLEYLASFRRQFEELYPTRRKLLLTAPNEYGVEKFVCTTVRPTLLPYRSIYDMAPCAEFVANFLRYEPLEQPGEVPAVLPSPSQVLKWTLGDSFDFSIVLCSFLLGAGYDAFVVYGKAPSWIALRDQTKSQCPYLTVTGMPQDGLMPHENGIGIPASAAAAAAKAEAKGDKPSDSKKEKRREEGINNGSVNVNGRMNSKGEGGEEGATATGNGGMDGEAQSKGGGDDNDAKDAQKEANGENTDGSQGEREDGEEGEGDGEVLEEEEEGMMQADAKPYAVKPRGVPVSKFLQEEEKRRLASLATKKEQWESDNDDDDDDDAVNGMKGYNGEGSYFGKGGYTIGDAAAKVDWLHAWVLVRAGKRGVDKSVFVEASTGCIYETDGSPYLSVEAIYNATNFWANMQQNLPVANTSFDTLDESLWEYALIDAMTQGVNEPSILQSGSAETEPGAIGLGNAALGVGDSGGQLNRNGNGHGLDLMSPGDGDNHDQKAVDLSQLEENILDLPRSWVSRLQISAEMFALRYPLDGQRTILYRRSKLELFAEKVHPQGLTMRVTCYKDRKRTITKDIREVFVHRKDKLVKRIRYPLEGKIYEAYLPGRPGGLKQLREWTGKRRQLEIYVDARLDRLQSREEEIGKKVIERYSGRPDKLIYRSINVMTQEEASATGVSHTYVLPGSHRSKESIRGGNVGDDGDDDGRAGPVGGGVGRMSGVMGHMADDGGSSTYFVIYKMTQKFERDESKPADVDIAKRTYYVSEGRIQTLYHYGKDSTTRTSRTRYKDHSSSSNANVGGVGGGAGAGPGGAGGRGDTGMGNGRVGEETLQQVVLSEKDCFTEARHIHMEMLENLGIRLAEEMDVTLALPIFDTARRGQTEGANTQETAAQEEDEDAHDHVDYLTPFLQHTKDLKTITKEAAYRARDACLKALKDRLLERANIINARLNEENAALSKKQAAFERNQRDNDAMAEEEFEQFCSEAMFRIQILEQRLVQHEESALKKYADMDAKLSADPRLQIIHH